MFHPKYRNISTILSDIRNNSKMALIYIAVDVLLLLSAYLARNLSFWITREVIYFLRFDGLFICYKVSWPAFKTVFFIMHFYHDRCSIHFFFAPGDDLPGAGGILLSKERYTIVSIINSNSNVYNPL